MRYSEKSDETARKLAALFALVGRYRDLSAVLDAGELIGRLVAEKKWFAVVFASDGAESKADALNSFLKHVNAYGGGGASVGEYAGYIRDETDDYALPPTADSVRVMTIHASKGLEFPFVYLMGTGGKFNFRDLGSSVILNKDVGVAIRDYDLVEHKEIRNRLTFAARLQLKKTLEEEKCGFCTSPSPAPSTDLTCTPP
ncbi:MAG: 3'-5' exonuclease [Christensenellales bacterium]